MYLEPSRTSKMGLFVKKVIGEKLKLSTGCKYASEFWTDFTHCSGFSIVDFKQENVKWVTEGFSTSFMSTFTPICKKLILKKNSNNLMLQWVSKNCNKFI